MEILSEGKLPSERKYTGTCGNCHTRVRFTQGEACSSGPPDPCFYVPCPKCKHTNIVGRAERGPAPNQPDDGWTER